MTHDRTQNDEPQAGLAVDWAAELAAHAAWLRKVIAARVGEWQAVDDVFQEVAVAAVEQRSPLADRSKAAPWLYRLAVLHSLRYRRRLGRQRKHEICYAESTNGHSEHDRDEIPIEWLLRKERRELMQAALAQLGGRDSEILMLKYFENWSYRQISERLGISQPAVDSRLHRARRRLRAALERLA